MNQLIPKYQLRLSSHLVEIPADDRAKIYISLVSHLNSKLRGFVIREMQRRTSSNNKFGPRGPDNDPDGPDIDKIARALALRRELYPVNDAPGGGHLLPADKDKGLVPGYEDAAARDRTDDSSDEFLRGLGVEVEEPLKAAEPFAALREAIYAEALPYAEAGPRDRPMSGNWRAAQQQRGNWIVQLGFSLADSIRKPRPFQANVEGAKKTVAALGGRMTLDQAIEKQRVAHEQQLQRDALNVDTMLEIADEIDGSAYYDPAASFVWNVDYAFENIPLADQFMLYNTLFNKIDNVVSDLCSRNRVPNRTVDDVTRDIYLLGQVSKGLVADIIVGFEQIDHALAEREEITGVMLDYPLLDESLRYLRLNKRPSQRKVQKAPPPTDPITEALKRKEQEKQAEQAKLAAQVDHAKPAGSKPDIEQINAALDSISGGLASTEPVIDPAQPATPEMLATLIKTKGKRKPLKLKQETGDDVDHDKPQ